jgi:hypothetical protein
MYAFHPYGALLVVTDYIPITRGTKLETQAFKDISPWDLKEKKIRAPFHGHSNTKSFRGGGGVCGRFGVLLGALM